MTEERYEELERLKIQAIDLFANQPNLNDKKVVAAIITAATGMSIASETGNKEATREMLLEAFGVTNDEEVNSLLDMSPTYVKALTGFAVNFNDYGAARVEYESKQYEYDKMFGEVNYLNQQKSNGIQM